MRSLTFSFIVIFSSFLWVSCGSPSSPSEELEIDSADSLFVLNGLSKAISISIPKELISSTLPEYGYNDNFGQLEFEIGESFDLQITEESLSLLGLKDELENDLMFSYDYMVVNDSELVYQTFLPDGNPYSYQFVKALRMKGLNLIVRTDPMGNFNQMQLERMEKALTTLSIAD